MKERLCECRYTMLRDVVRGSKRRGDVSRYRRRDYNVAFVLLHKMGREGTNAVDNPIEEDP